MKKNTKEYDIFFVPEGIKGKRGRGGFRGRGEIQEGGIVGCSEESDSWRKIARHETFDPTLVVTIKYIRP